MLVPILAIAFALGFTERRLLSLPLAAFLPVILMLTGAFDDGEGVGTLALASVLFTGLAGVGLLMSIGVQRLSNKHRPA
jgi:p-aminobenzoyl-glutamate transporter AbgT